MNTKLGVDVPKQEDWSEFSGDDIDALWDDLLSPDRLKVGIEKARKEFSGVPKKEVMELRRQSKIDLAFLCTGILGYDELTVSLHYHLCKWLKATEEDQFRITLMPRGHFKTTIVTIGDTIQICLTDDVGDQPYPRNLGPDVRLLLAHETAEGASRFNFEITGHFISNPVLMGLFPELVPHPRKQRMNKRELELPRSIIRAEPTIDTLGVGGKSQGRHYNRIKLDDIFGDKARDSAAERDTTIEWFDNIQAFLTKLTRDGVDMVGTRYSLDDVWGHAMEIYGDRLRRYIRRIEEVNPETGELESIFPEHFATWNLEILRKNKRLWASQYVNDPIAGLARFDPENLRFYEWANEDRNKIVVFTGEASHVYHVHDLDIIILCDPAVTRSPGIVVTGVSPDLKVFILETIKEEMNPTQFVNRLFPLVQKWWPRMVGIERVIFSEVYEHWLKREMTLRGVNFTIEPLIPPQALVKEERVLGLEPYFSALQIFMNQEQKELIKEYHEFGATKNIHLLDALAYGPRYWRAGLSREVWQRYREIENDMFRHRDPMTGYSR